ncbi:NAD-dependent epimerase/dehydratase family protein [Knoellia sp. CPCC 206453]|uniref:NAD-dependent epimerase/dehydratase family protein n=1 Tax=Knoellia pratensis TaxID=3404796 RepID=UPI00360F6EA9
MSWSQSNRAVLALTPDAVFATLSTVELWSQWCPGVSAASFDGPLRVGQSGSMALGLPVVGPIHRVTAPPLVVREFEPGSRILLEQAQPGGALTIEWTVTPDPRSPALTLLTQRLAGWGPLSFGMGPVARRALGSDFAMQALRLWRLAGGVVDPEALRVVVAGGSGTLGRRLVADLACRGHDVVVLTRSSQPDLPVRQAIWDGSTVGDWAAELEPSSRTAVVNLAGRLVDLRPTPANIASLRDSRVDSTRALVGASASLTAPLAAWVQASTTAIYSDAGEAEIDESSPVPVGLPQMTGVAQPWEDSVQGAVAEHLHVLRTSLVLDRGAPVVARLVGLTRAGWAARLAPDASGSAGSTSTTGSPSCAPPWASSPACSCPGESSSRPRPSPCATPSSWRSSVGNCIGPGRHRRPSR